MNSRCSSRSRLHSILFDGSNKPVFVGNPLTNSQLSELFRSSLEK